MATVALAAAAIHGGATAGSMALIAATTLGSFIDSMLVLPALFPGEPVDVGRIGDLRLMGVNAGAPANFVVGKRARVSGQLIWQNNFVEVVSSVGGKGQTVSNYAYYISCQIEITRNQINAIKQAWADGKQVYDAENTSRNVTSSKIWLDNYPGVSNRAYLRFKNSTEFDDWYAGVGAEVTLSGFTGGWTANNGTFEVIGKGIYNTSLGSYLLIERSSGLFTVDANFAETDTITASQPTAGWASDMQRTAGSVPTFYLGNPLATAPPHIEAIEGSGNVPGYRKIAHCVFNQHTLRYYGNRIASWEYLVEQDATGALEDSFDDIFEEAGLDAAYFDTTLLSGTNEGYNVTGIQTVARVLAPLMLYHKIYHQERAGKVHFFHEGDVESFDVSDGDILGDDISVERADYRDRPGEVVISHIDASNDYKVSAQRATYAEHIGRTKHEISLPLVIGADDARAYAKEILWRMRADVIRLKFRLGPKFMRIRESDRINLTWKGYDLVALVIQATHGADFSVEIDAVSDNISGISFPLEA